MATGAAVDEQPWQIAAAVADTLHDRVCGGRVSRVGDQRLLAVRTTRTVRCVLHATINKSVQFSSLLYLHLECTGRAIPQIDPQQQQQQQQQQHVTLPVHLIASRTASVPPVPPVPPPLPPLPPSSRQLPPFRRTPYLCRCVRVRALLFGDATTSVLQVHTKRSCSGC